jgi:hypothetical protein
MDFQNFDIEVAPYIANAVCKCGNSLREVSSDSKSVAMFCSECNNVYEPKLVKIPSNKVTEEFIERAKKELATDDDI